MPAPSALAQSRSNTYHLHPDDIDANALYNGRWEETPTPADLIADLLEVGQLQPVAIRANPDKEGKPILVYGFRRYHAARIINERKLTTEPFLLRCEVRSVTDQEALLQNVLENMRRSATSPIDDAHNLRKLLESGLTPDEIKKKLQISNSWYAGRLSLLQLSPKLQGQVHNGTLGVDAALQLTSSSEQVQEEVAGKIESGEQVSRSKARAVRQEVEAQEPEPAPETPATDSVTSAKASKKAAKKAPGRPRKATAMRTLKEVKVLVSELSAKDDDPVVHLIGGLFQSWLDGKLKNQGLVRKLSDLIATAGAEK